MVGCDGNTVFAKRFRAGTLGAASRVDMHAQYARIWMTTIHSS